MTSAGPPDLEHQDRILEKVSRTFALTIPGLPRPVPAVGGVGEPAGSGGTAAVAE
ncbi:MAG: hypothetical protein KatS3mg123_2097 [Burkholderiales bacterium]|nr:MAG: hypothetical protein KatS3mg123_2097 [Burkholderiales bacterium]